jgi:DNA-directed RNA polymerase specialized sigma subunit, sigma24 homolog
MTMTDAESPATREDDLDQLLVRAGSGDCDAFVAFYDATAPRVYAILLSLTGVADKANRMLEGIYVEAWERMRGRNAPPCPGMQWVSAIAHRHASARA